MYMYTYIHSNKRIHAKCVCLCKILGHKTCQRCRLCCKSLLLLIVSASQSLLIMFPFKG